MVVAMGLPWIVGVNEQVRDRIADTLSYDFSGGIPSDGTGARPVIDILMISSDIAEVHPHRISRQGLP
jgi:hypothetical protein